MKTYIVTRKLMLKYADVFGINPEEWKNGLDDEQWVIAREKELPLEIAREAEEMESYIVDSETGLQYEPTLLDFGDMAGHAREN